VNELLSTFIKPEIARIIYGAMFIGVILFVPNGIVAFIKRREKVSS
jgi:branched-chain amino acid transport system permease protein